MTQLLKCDYSVTPEFFSPNFVRLFNSSVVMHSFFTVLLKLIQLFGYSVASV